MVPNGWKKVSLGSCLIEKPSYGANAPAVIFSPDLPRYIRITDIDNYSKLRSEDPVSIDYQAASEYLLKNGDFLIARSGNTVGKSLRFTADMGSCAYAGYLLRFRFDEDITSSNYFKFIAQSDKYWNWIKSNIRAGAQPNINAQEYSSFEFLLPESKKEQEKIAKILSIWDEAIELINRQIKVKNNQFEWYLSNLLSSHSDRMKETWRTYRLGELAQFINGRGFKQSEWSSSGLSIIRIQNLNGSREFNYYNGEYDDKHYINHGDLLFAWSGNRGTSFGPNMWSGMPGLLNQHIFKVQTTGLISKEFLYLVLKFATKVIEHKAHGASGLVHVTKSELEKFIVELPNSKTDLLNISNFLLGNEFEIALLNKKLELYKVQKQGLMQQLLTGKKRVSI